jgi:hypothetical protein
MHLHYVPTADPGLSVVEIRQGSRRWSIGRIGGGQRRGSWIGIGIAEERWSPWLRTRRDATLPMLARAGLELTGDRYTVDRVLVPGAVVVYHGSLAYHHGERLTVAEPAQDSAGRYTLLYELGDVALRQVRRASVTATGEVRPMCKCGHPVDVHHEPDQHGLTCSGYPCNCYREVAAEQGALVGAGV